MENYLLAKKRLFSMSRIGIVNLDDPCAQRMMDGTFTMDDMLSQLDQIRKLGPLTGIMKLMPGFNQYADLVDDAKASDSMKHMRAIIQSMTPAERADPSRMRSSMKRRVAAGSGTSVTEVNKAINSYERMKKLMMSMGRLQKSGKLNEESLNKMMDNLPDAAKRYRR